MRNAPLLVALVAGAAAGDDALPVVPLVIGLLVLGAVGAALLAWRGAGRPAPRRDAPKPGRLDSH